MAFNNIRNDKFGNPYQLKTAEQVTGKDGELVNSYKTFAELGGKLYKIEISERQKETKSGKPAMWVKITAVKKQPKHSSM